MPRDLKPTPSTQNPKREAAAVAILIPNGLTFACRPSRAVCDKAVRPDDYDEPLDPNPQVSPFPHNSLSFTPVFVPLTAFPFEMSNFYLPPPLSLSSFSLIFRQSSQQCINSSRRLWPRTTIMARKSRIPVGIFTVMEVQRISEAAKNSFFVSGFRVGPQCAHVCYWNQ